MMPQTTMDFFAREEGAQRASRRLGWLFVLAVLGTLVIINVATSFFFDLYRAHRYDDSRFSPGTRSQPLSPDEERTLRLATQLGVTLVTLAIIGLGSLWKMAELGGGGAVVASALGGRALNRTARDAKERMLLNVVEEMAIASGVPLPEVFVLDQEGGINAFAAGTHPNNAVVAVTRGALDQLSRDELQGVIGHEFSHILHGDMRINLRMMGLVHGLLVIGLTGALLFRLGTSVRSSSSRNPLLLLAVIGGVAYIVGYIGFFFGGLIKSAISRQREYLADASSVQFTRNPAGLAGALKRLGAGYPGARLEHANAHEASHFLFGDGVGGSWMTLLATHPPLESRILAIEPQWDGSYPAWIPPPPEPPPADLLRQPGALHQRGPTATLAPNELVARIGTVSPEHVVFGALLLASIPEALQQAAAEPYAARALCLCLLLDGELDGGQAGLATISASDAGLASTAQRLLREVAARGAAAHLPLLDLCLPALRQLSDNQRQAFLDLVARLQSGSHGRMRAYCIATLLRTRLSEQPGGAGGDTIMSVQPIWKPLLVLLSGLARAGIATGDGAPGGDEREAVTALRAGAARLLPEGGSAELLSVSACAASQLDAALTAISRAAPGVKRRIVTACAWCIAADGVVTVGEAELLRVVCSCLGCPMPLFAPPA